MKRNKSLGRLVWSAGLYGALLLLLAGGEAMAATYYVSPTGNDANIGSLSSPFNTIQKAANIVNPGDTVIVKNGIYTDTDGDDRIVNMTRGGASGAWVTFKSENKWGAVLDGLNQTDTGARYCFIGGSASANYIRIEGFEIRNCDNGTFHNLAEHDIYIYNNYIHDTGRRTNNTMYGMTGSYSGPGTNNFTWDSNIFRAIGRLNPYTTPSATEASCTTPPDYVFGGVPHGNEVHCYSHDHGLYINSSNNTIINNVFSDIKSGWAGIFNNNAINHIVVNNTFVGDNPQRQGQLHFKWNNTNVTLKNNIFDGDAVCGLLIYAGSSGIISNNLIYPNIAVRCTDAYTDGTTFTLAANLMNQNPLFVNADTFNFHLQSGSPAINKGLAYPGRTVDADGKPIVGAPDIGAYENTGSAGLVPAAPGMQN